MKKELIRTENYLLVVDDSDIKEGDWYYLPRTNSPHFHASKNALKELNLERSVGVKKILAHLPLEGQNLYGLYLLPPLEFYDDVNKMAKDYLFNDYQKQFKIENNDEQFGVLKGYRDGYNKAREKYKFTEKQIDVAIDWAIKKGREGDVTITDIDNLIQSLSQPKMPTHFEFEMERGFQNELGDFYYSLNSVVEVGKTTPICRIKTTTNSTTTSQSQVIACGKYIY